MSTNCFNELVFSSTNRIVMPIAVYPGMALTGARVCDVVSNPQVQVEVQAALHERYQTSFVLSAMDLSAEAEAFGSTISISETEVPTVTGRLVTNLEQAQSLAIPEPGDKRTSVHLETVRRLRALPDRPMVFGGCIGPFSLASRLVGVSESMEMTVLEPDLLHAVLEKCTVFLTDYVKAFRAAGADGVIMAEPVAGLLSPPALAEFSSAYVKIVSDALADSSFAIILHNCGANPHHLEAILESGVKAFHFGAPMNMVEALEQIPSDVVLCGNLDPSGVFCRLPPGEVTARTESLLTATAAHRNFVLSSGCDLPPNAQLASLDAFFAAAKAARLPSPHDCRMQATAVA